MWSLELYMACSFLGHSIAKFEVSFYTVEYEAPSPNFCTLQRETKPLETSHVTLQLTVAFSWEIWETRDVNIGLKC